MAAFLLKKKSFGANISPLWPRLQVFGNEFHPEVCAEWSGAVEAGLT